MSNVTDTHDVMEQYWLQARSMLQPQNDESVCSKNKRGANEEKCDHCGNLQIYYNNNETVCYECGLILNSAPFDSTPTFESTPTTYRKPSAPNHKLTKLQNWYMWSNEEKNAYKLSTYTKTLCTQLSVHESLVPSICDTVCNVMDTIKKYDGTKRARVKDGIILVCIQFVSKDASAATELSAVELARKLKLDIKYITKAEKLILELVNGGKLHFSKQCLLGFRTPFDYVKETIHKKHLKIPEPIISKVEWLIRLCEANDLLLDHTPMSVGVCCFYYILKTYDISIDTRMFSELYDLSFVTLIKTYNKLKQSEQFIQEHLQTL